MANPDCPDCQAAVDVINRKMLEAGRFTANSAYRDGEMRLSRDELLSDLTVGCDCHKDGEIDNV